VVIELEDGSTGKLVSAARANSKMGEISDVVPIEEGSSIYATVNMNESLVSQYLLEEVRAPPS
jgi:hypothetical protein